MNIKRIYCTRKVKIAVAIALGVPLLTLIVLFLVCLGNTLDAKKPAWLQDLDDGQAVELLPEEDKENRLERFRRALRFKTISTSQDEQLRVDELEGLVKFLVEAFPTIHKSPHVTWARIGTPEPGYSLLYKVTATEPGPWDDNGEVEPYLFMAHLDVVPVEEEYWNYKPFDATIEDGFVYARGSIDDKNNALSILEALEYKLKKGGAIKRSFFIALGHDEEIGGNQGQQFVGQFLREQWGVQELAFIMDEGLFVIDNLIPGVSGPVALIGVTEKGSANVDLTISGMNAGHSSNPPRESTIDILAEAILRLRSRPHPRSFNEKAPEYQLLENLAPYSSFLYKLVYSNLWLLSGVVGSQLESKRVTNAAIRTTTAFTMVQGGIKVNVMPASATATVNHRVHYSQSIGDVVAHDREAVDDDRVDVILRNGSYPAHPVSPFGGDAPYYKLIAKSVLQIYPGVPVGPGTLIANTDTRWFLNFTRNIYRFSPTRMDEKDTTRFHGHDERISIESFYNVNNFYYRLMENAEQVSDTQGAGRYRKEGEL